MSTCRASCAARFGRNPNEHANMSASKIGSSTIFTAACTTRSATEGIDSGLCSDDPGLGMNTRRAGSGRQRPSLNAAATSSSSRDTPYSSTSAMVIRSIPAAPRLRRTSSHARSRTSLRWTLSPSAWNRRPGSALAARYSACCKARTGSITDPEAAELAETALTGLLQDKQYAPTKQRPFPHRRLCCPLGSSSTTAASDAHPAHHPLPGANRL